MLKKTPFGLIIDETTDRSIVSQLGVICQHWDPQTGETIVKLLSMLVCKDATADGLSSSVLNLLNEHDIPKKKYEIMLAFTNDQE